MSRSNRVNKQTAQGTTNSSPSCPKYETVEATTPHTFPGHDNFPDSGYYEDTTAVCYDSNGVALFEQNGHKPSAFEQQDFVLFAEDARYLEEDYFLTEDDSVDIASTKANHGSIYSGQRNETTRQIVSGTSYSHQHNASGSVTYDFGHEASYVYEVVEEDGRLPHRFSNLEYGSNYQTPFEMWTGTTERYESIAYRPVDTSDSKPKFQRRRHEQ